MSMQLALAYAERAFHLNEVPVGAVLVKDHIVVAAAHNAMRSQKNPLAHAEMLVLQDSLQMLQQGYLDECDLYVTLEPCPLCAAAIKAVRLRCLFFGAYDPKGGGVDHGPRLLDKTAVKVIGGLEETACAQLLKDFFASKR